MALLRGIQVKHVDGWSGVAEFLEVPRELYRGDPCWVGAPDLYQRRRLDPEREPFWRHADRALLVARRGARPAGRVLVIHNRLLETTDDVGVAHLSLFESVEEPEVAGALLAEAAAWARGRGLTRLRGPVGFGLHDEVGLLVEGFDRSPRFGMPYNPPYYPRLLEQMGFSPAREFGAYDWAAWDLPLPPAPLGQRADRAARGRIELTCLDGDRVPDQVADFVRLRNAALRETWGYCPMTHEEGLDLLEHVAAYGDPRLVWQARVDGRPAGFLLAVPDLNEALRRARSGLGLLALAKALYLKRGVRAARVVSLAVLPEFRRLNLAGHLIYRAWQAAMDAGLLEAEFSPVDQADEALTRLLARIGCRRSRRAVVYDKSLLGAAA